MAPVVRTQFGILPRTVVEIKSEGHMRAAQCGSDDPSCSAEDLRAHRT